MSPLASQATVPFSSSGVWLCRLAGGFRCSLSGFSTVLAQPLMTFFSDPASFAPQSLRPFYASLLRAWRAIQGSFFSSSALVVCSSQYVDPVAVDSVSTKSCYVLLFSLSPCTLPPHVCLRFLPFMAPLIGSPPEPLCIFYLWMGMFLM